jgi:squalene-hopene/tetraprenyl-beta-curcumene cyclase
LSQQNRAVHPYTHAAPGGWAWTDLSGGVPDADDTPGALLALAKLGPPDACTLDAAAAGVRWLLDLQNADGGIPTFCKGWTGLPFDRSSADLTAHTLLAWAAWRSHLDEPLRKRIDHGVSRAVAYLISMQGQDGQWAPLWFGNQHASEIENLTYGTSRVLRVAAANADLGVKDLAWNDALERAALWIAANQNPDGGWGGRIGTPSSVEETALAVEGQAAVRDPDDAAIARGVAWLAEHTRGGTHFPPSPIGFYFANLWYFEKLYPLLFTTAALSSVSASSRR